MTRRVRPTPGCFAALLAERTGLCDLSPEALALALDTRRRLTGCRDLDAYWQRLACSPSGPEEMRALASALTVGETYFFRTPEHFRAFAEVALPDRLRRRVGHRPLRVLSVGCASGEEAYTLAMVAMEQWPSVDADAIALEAIDVHADQLARARRASYTDWSLRATPKPYQQRYFRRDGDAHRLVPALAGKVLFSERNVFDADDAFWAAGSVDVIFFRNVSIYFTPDATRRAIARFARALAPGGYLFLGPVESLRGISDDFDLRESHGTFYYQRKDQDAPPAPAARPLGDGLPWLHSINQASQRIAALVGRAPLGEPAGPQSPDRLAAALALVREERFLAALEHLEGLPIAARQAPDALLLRAATLSTVGRFLEAEAACHEVLALEAGCAEAHYVLALCQEQAHRAEAAASHHETAMRLDPTFAMPYMHRGRLLRRAGATERAAEAWRQALSRLPQETPARLLLFGGGFRREALEALCRTELQACGGER